MGTKRVDHVTVLVAAPAMLLALSACQVATADREAAAVDQSIVRMTAEQIVETHRGNSAEGVTALGQPFQVFFSPDGHSHAIVGETSDKLAYEITDDDRVCGAWTTWLSGEETCYTIYDEGDAGYRFYDQHGGFRGQYVIRDGNPFKL